MDWRRWSSSVMVLRLIEMRSMLMSKLPIEMKQCFRVKLSWSRAQSPLLQPTILEISSLKVRLQIAVIHAVSMLKHNPVYGLTTPDLFLLHGQVILIPLWLRPLRSQRYRNRLAGQFGLGGQIVRMICAARRHATAVAWPTIPVQFRSGQNLRNCRKTMDQHSAELNQQYQTEEDDKHQADGLQFEVLSSDGDLIIADVIVNCVLRVERPLDV